MYTAARPPEAGGNKRLGRRRPPREKKRRLAGKMERSYMIHLRLLCARDSIRSGPAKGPLPHHLFHVALMHGARIEEPGARAAIDPPSPPVCTSGSETLEKYTDRETHAAQKTIYTLSLSPIASGAVLTGYTRVCAHYFRFQMRKCALGCAFIVSLDLLVLLLAFPLGRQTLGPDFGTFV